MSSQNGMKSTDNYLPLVNNNIIIKRCRQTPDFPDSRWRRSKPEVVIFQHWTQLETKFQGLTLCFQCRPVRISADRHRPTLYFKMAAVTSGFG